MARTITGTVVSDKADKTIVLQTTVRNTHPLYKKQYTVSKKFIAHDENNEAKIGDLVEVVETRPISARKRLKLTKIIEKADITADKTVEAVTAYDEGSELKIQEEKQAEAEAKKAEVASDDTKQSGEEK